MADSAVASLSAASALTGAELLYAVQSAADKKATIDQIKTYIGNGQAAGYVAGRWYLPQGVTTCGAGTAQGVNSIRLRLYYIPRQITIDTLGVNISTLGAGGNIQLAIYAHDTATGKPTGTALVSTSSITTASTGVVNAAASLQLGPGYYWFASNTDSAAVVVRAEGAATAPSQSMNVGSTTQINVWGSSVLFGGYTFAQTFGTWPDLTGQTMVDNTVTTNIPVLTFKVASVP